MSLGHVLRIYIPNPFPGEAYAAGPDHSLKTDYQTSPKRQSRLILWGSPSLFTKVTTTSLGCQQKTEFTFLSKTDPFQSPSKVNSPPQYTPLHPQPLLERVLCFLLLTPSKLLKECFPASSLLKWRCLFSHPLHTNAPGSDVYILFTSYYFSMVITSSLPLNPSSFEIHTVRLHLALCLSFVVINQPYTLVPSLTAYFCTQSSFFPLLL